MPIIPSSSGMHRAQYVPFNAAKVVKGISLANIRNEKQNPFRCGMSSVSGAYHRDALGFAMSKSQDVMANASDLSAREQECIQRTLGWLNSGGGIGNIVLQRIAALGASHAAVVELVKDAPGDSDLRALERQVTKMIVDLGIAIGGCRTPPQGAALKTLEKAVAKLNDKADLCVKSCSSIIGGQRLMEAIGRAILPQPIMNALVDKRPDLVERISKDGAGAIDLTELLNAQAMRTVECMVNVELDVADPQAAVTAVIQLLKIPEFVVERDPGKEGAQPNKEKGVSDLPPGLREFAGDGKNVAVNYNDFGKMGNKSTVDGASAARLAEVDLEKHRITIHGMLEAFKLGLERNRGCGHLITDIHNPGGNVGTPAQDPRRATTTGSIEIQTDLAESAQLNGESLKREFHAGSNNVQNGNEEGAGTLHPQQHPVHTVSETNDNTFAEGDADDSLDDAISPDPSVRVNAQEDNSRSLDVGLRDGEQQPVGDDNDPGSTEELLRRFDNLRSPVRVDVNGRERIENETLRQSGTPLTYVTEVLIPVVEPQDADVNPDPPLANLLEDDARATNELASRLDQDATLTSNARSHDAPPVRAGFTTIREDESTARAAAAKMFQPINPVEEFKFYLDDLADDPMTRRVVRERPPRLVQGYEEVVDATGRKEVIPVRQDASRFALNFGAHVMPSDLVKYQKEQEIIKAAPWRGARHELAPEKHEYLELARVLNAREEARNAGMVLKPLNIREELKRINVKEGKDPAPQKTFGKAFERAAAWADAASKPVVPDAGGEMRDPLKAPRNNMGQVAQWLQSQPQQMDPVDPEAGVTPFSQPVPGAQDSHAKLRDMLSSLRTQPVKREPSVFGLLKGSAAPSSESAASDGGTGAHVAKRVLFDPPLNSIGSSAAPSEASDDDSIKWHQGTLDELMDEHSVQLDKRPRFVPNPQPLTEKPIVVNERDSMPIFSSGLTREQNLRMMQ
ncbi:hypothetical protein [Stenotrophomonas oahuensis]|uniref:Avirulence protein n=1 Tax=Stenotrophomonas oahuensis TaxID=3003271 RepID=A0ABY9YPW6_9GAMM|nr:hypothetical protein [Stenotrophomonas sp. A5586]WNH52952.1 hypothetical protein PDM29_01400 [Stenotrophomonas sp. A5586]